MQEQKLNTNVSAEQKAMNLLRQVKAKSINSNMTRFDGLVGVYLGRNAVEHYPKMLAADGTKIKETVNGREVDKRSSESDGWTHYFSELSSNKIIQVVLPNNLTSNLKLLGLYNIEGWGWDIKSGNLLFVEKEGKLTAY